MKQKKTIILSCTALLLICAGIMVWNTWFGSTKIAFVNFRTIQQGRIAKANDNPFIKLSEVSLDRLDRLTGYDMVLISGMGIRIVEEQRVLIQRAADKGIPVYTLMATNPANNICNLDSAVQTRLGNYLSNEGKANYKHLLNYIRREIDGKIISAPVAEEPVVRPGDVLYHANPQKKDDEQEFLTVNEYERFLRENGLYKENAPRILITGQMADATELIAALEHEGYNVYPLQSLVRFMPFVEEIRPDAIINMAHGRMGDAMVNYLQKNNIVLFDPLTINSLTVEWENDPMGMSGGFLSQSVVTPEIDGAIRTFALFAQYEDEEGLRHSYAVPERLKTFIATVNNYISLKKKPNRDKKVAVFYYKGPGQNALTASGMEVVPSIYNLLLRLKKEGYTVDNLPSSPQELEKMIQAQGSVFGTYAKGASERFVRNASPLLVAKEEYDEWIRKSIRSEKYAEVVDAFGEFPGEHMTAADNRLCIARLQFGNIVLLPQTAAGAGDNSFQVVHGTNTAPPHSYIAPYLWMQHGFKADALIHFGTHGSLEYTPKKQVALCDKDWSDRLVGPIPHFYLYTIGNVGEAMIAKRRSYAGIQSHITPPFMESSLRNTYRQLMEKIKVYHNVPESRKMKESIEVKKLAVGMGIHRELGLDSLQNTPYTEDEVMRIENFAEEIATEKITGQLYTMGIPYTPERITSSILAMATEPVAHSLYALDKQRGKAREGLQENRALFNRQYLTPARSLVESILTNPAMATDELICRVAGIGKEELSKAREISAARNMPKGMMAMMMAAASEQKKDKDSVQKPVTKESASGGMTGMMRKIGAGMKPEQALEMAKKMGASPEALKKMKAVMGIQDTVRTNMDKKPEQGQRGTESISSTVGMMSKATHIQPAKEYTKAETSFALAVCEVERTILNIGNYKRELQEAPEKELSSLLNALNGGYTTPGPGGDPIANPNALPTGRNLYGINAEATPSESAWEQGVALAKQTIEAYRKRHNDSIPRKVSYTLWSSEFIETNGATIAQILYMLGVEPLRDAFGRVSDLKLIPSSELKRPRIDVVVQTSGQLRDLAASRLFLINRAVEMASAAKDDEYPNMVLAGVVEAEKKLIEKGLTPKDAREISTYRVFGGLNGMYGTGIQEMVEAGNRWENETELATVYLNNMGAYYGNERNWETFYKFAFEAALTRTDAVVQPRQSNTWGALSLDHVYEFMGGLSLAVRNVTGKDPDAYLSDYRNRNHMRMQELKEAVGVESRTTILNPAYIREKMKGEASSADEFAEIITNTYGWNVMKPAVIDNELWDNIYNVYVKDEYRLGIREFFEQKNPAALQEMSAVMLETIRKGLWKASDEQTGVLAKLHTDLVNRHKPSCSGFVCDNAKLLDFIASNTEVSIADEYKTAVNRIREEKISETEKSVVMKKETMNPHAEGQTKNLSNALIGVITLTALFALILLVRKRRKYQDKDK